MRGAVTAIFRVKCDIERQAKTTFISGELLATVDVSATRNAIKMVIQGLEELTSLDGHSPESVFTFIRETPPKMCLDELQ